MLEEWFRGYIEGLLVGCGGGPPPPPPPPPYYHERYTCPNCKAVIEYEFYRHRTEKAALICPICRATVKPEASRHAVVAVRIIKPGTISPAPAPQPTPSAQPTGWSSKLPWLIAGGAVLLLLVVIYGRS